MSIYDDFDNDHMLSVTANTGGTGRVEGDLSAAPFITADSKFYGCFYFAPPLTGTLEPGYLLAQYNNTGTGGNLFVYVTTDQGPGFKTFTRIRVENATQVFLSDFLVDTNVYRTPVFYYWYVDFETPANSFVGCDRVPPAAFNNTPVAGAYTPTINTSILFTLPIGCVIGRYVFNMNLTGGVTMPSPVVVKRLFTERIIKPGRSVQGAFGLKGGHVAQDNPFEYFPLNDTVNFNNEGSAITTSYTRKYIAFDATFYAPHRPIENAAVSRNALTITSDLVTDKIYGSFARDYDGVNTALFSFWYSVGNISERDRIDIISFKDGKNNDIAIGTTFGGGVSFKFDLTVNGESILESSAPIGSDNDQYKHIMFFYTPGNPANSILKIDGEYVAITVSGGALSLPLNGIRNYELFGGSEDGVEYAQIYGDFNNPEAGEAFEVKEPLFISRDNESLDLGLKGRSIRGFPASFYFRFNGGTDIIEEVSGVAATVDEEITFVISTDKDVEVGQ